MHFRKAPFTRWSNTCAKESLSTIFPKNYIAYHENTVTNLMVFLGGNRQCSALSAAPDAVE